MDFSVHFLCSFASRSTLFIAKTLGADFFRDEMGEKK